MFSSYNFNPFTVCFQFMKVSLLVANNQDGDCQNAKFEAKKNMLVHKPMGDVTVTTSTSYIQYYCVNFKPTLKQMTK